MASEKDKKELEQQIAYLEEKLSSLAEKSTIKLTFDTSATNQITEQLDIQSSLNKNNIENVKDLLAIENERLKLMLKAKPEQANTIRSQIELNSLKSKQLKDYEEEQSRLKKTLEANIGIKDEVFSITKKYEEIKELSKLQLTREEAIEVLKKKQQQIMSGITESIMKMSGVILDRALEFEGAAKSLMKAGTFTQEEAINGLMNVTNQAAMAGVGLKQASDAMVGLKTSFSGFTNLVPAQQTKITTLVATMERMGISVSASAKFLDTATKSLGMSTTQATNFLSSLEGFAKKSGIPIAELSKNLEGATDKIALFGDKGTEVFKEMSLVSKQLGIEMNTLYNITERFTTFEGAADAAGKLNAILGGNFINSVDLLTASMEDPAEAFKMLKVSMDQSGQSFDQMDNGMKRVIASSIGMTVEQAGKLFSQDINTATVAMREQAKTQEELTKIGAELTTIQEKFQNALIKLWPTLQPVVEMLANLGMQVFDLVEKFFKIEGIIPMLETFVIVVVGLGTAFSVFSAIFLPIVAAVQSYAAVMTALGGIQKIYTALKIADTTASIAQGTAEAGKSAALAAGTPVTAVAGTTAAGAATGFLALGAGILMAGLGIALVIGSIALLAYAIKDLSGTQMLFLLGITLGIIAAFAIFAIVAVKMTMPLLFAAGSILALGEAALIASLPIALISASISLMALSIADMASKMTEFNKSLTSVNETVVTKYNSIANAFKLISGYMKEIDSAKLGMLLTAGTLAKAENFLQASPQSGKQVDLNFEITDAETGQTAKTSSSGGSGGSSNQVIHINLNIDSPIMLEKEQIGKFTHTEVTNVLADGAVRGIVPSRG